MLKLDKCCLCIDLRTGCIILASLGILFNLAYFIRHVSVANGVFFIGSALFCLLGLVGVLKNNFKLVATFAYFYWVNVVLSFIVVIVSSVIVFGPNYNKELCQGMIDEGRTDMDLDTCISVMFKASVLVVLFLSIKSLIELHFCLAVWTYYQKLKGETLGERLINEEPAPRSTYGTAN